MKINLEIFLSAEMKRTSVLFSFNVKTAGNLSPAVYFEANKYERINHQLKNN